jgi:hypothetical protein
MPIDIFPPTQPHQDVQIIGDTISLHRLRNAIDKSLKAGSSDVEDFDSEGESLTIKILLMSSDEMSKLPSHYRW